MKDWLKIELYAFISIFVITFIISIFVITLTPRDLSHAPITLLQSIYVHSIIAFVFACISILAGLVIDGLIIFGLVIFNWRKFIWVG